MDCAGYSSRGGREYNEDTCKAWQDDDRIYALVADGLGGQGGGDIASAMLLDRLKERLENDDQIIALSEITEDLKRINTEIVKLQTRGAKMMSTLVLLCIRVKEKYAEWCHLGDSRLYHFHNGKLVSCTFDHSVSRMLAYQGKIDLTDVRFHPDRNRVLKAVGMDPFPEPEFGSCHIGSGDAFLLCTDGFWEYITEDVMEETLRSSNNASEWLRRMRVAFRSRKLVDNDNHTAIAIFI